jgi:uncharacterized phage-associated protein
MRAYDSVLMAKYLVATAFEMKTPLNMTKLQKLLYILYGFYLSKHGCLIINENPKIWPFGPVFPRVHKHVEPTDILDIYHPDFQQINEDEQLRDVINSIVNKYSKISATQLSNWSHMIGSPWEKTVKASGNKWNTIIPDEYISTYFSNIVII